MTTTQTRPAIVGADIPESPYPVNLKGKVTKGFGRGSKDLGIPTGIRSYSSLPLGKRRVELCRRHLETIDKSSIHDQPPLPIIHTSSPSMSVGSVLRNIGLGLTGDGAANLPESVAEAAGKTLVTGIYYGWASVGSSSTVWPMVMSFGWNPYYKNEKRTAEVHILHVFEKDFYDEELRVIVTGYIRDEKNYESLEALIEDINTDIRVAKASLARPAYQALKSSEFLKP